LDWELKDRKATLKPIHCQFLNYRNSIRIGKGDIEKTYPNQKVQMK